MAIFLCIMEESYKSMCNFLPLTISIKMLITPELQCHYQILLRQMFSDISLLMPDTMESQALMDQYQTICYL